MELKNDLAISNENELVLQERAIPTSPEELQHLLQNMTHRDQPVSNEEMMQAAELLQEIVSSSSPAVEVSKHLNEIDNLMPAIIDLNIQQAKKEGRPDLASGLLELKKNISLQMSIQEEAVQARMRNSGKPVIPEEALLGKVAVFEPSGGEFANCERIKLLKEALLSAGSLMTEKEIIKVKPDLAIFSNPFMDAHLMDLMAKFSVARVPIILDIDPSFEKTFLTRTKNVENNLPVIDRKLVASLFLANLITTSSDPFAENLRAAGYPAMAIANGWSIFNPYWGEKKEKNNPTIQLGWFGNLDDLDDLAAIRRPLVRILREFDDKVRIIIIGNQNAYRIFDLIPDNLKTYIPCCSQEEIPYLLNQIDILLLPLWKTNTSKLYSDDLLMYAGIKNIPWVASFCDSTVKWAKGGMLCNSLEEWHTNLRYLILDKELRSSLGAEGFNKATQREMRTHIDTWYKAIDLVLAFQKNKKAAV